MNILVVRNDKLGDFITALPTLYALKNYSPQNRVIALVAPLNRAIVEYCDFIDDVIVDENDSALMLSKKIKSKNIDASITLFSNTKVALAQFLVQIPIRIAPATKLAQFFYNRRIIQRRSQVKMAEFEYNLELSKALFADISLDFPRPIFNFDDKNYREFCADYEIEKPIIAFHIGFGGSSDANWSLDEYVKLIDIARSYDNYQIVMTFGPDEEELMGRAREAVGEEGVVYYMSTNGLVHFASLLAHMRLFISTSTGTYHLASASGCETMTSFADTLFASAARWKSIGDTKKQHHYMIPLDSDGRARVFDKFKTDLINLLG